MEQQKRRTFAAYSGGAIKWISMGRIVDFMKIAVVAMHNPSPT
jgi:hypothetical protein